MTLLRFTFALSICVVLVGCSTKQPEDPFHYPFVREIHISRDRAGPYNNARALYLLTEDLEPSLKSVAEVEDVRGVLRYASDLSAEYGIPWTHFVDISAFESAFVSNEDPLKTGCRSLLDDLKHMIERGDDGQLHLHGQLSGRMREFLRAEEKLRAGTHTIEDRLSYRQRKSFFFDSFYRRGYRELVLSLTYGKYAIDRYLYDGQSQVVAFRPGGWDHGSSEQDTLLYFSALASCGFAANSGLSTGHFGSSDWHVGDDPGHNLASIQIGESKVLEISPTRAPGAYLNPVLPNDLQKLSRVTTNELPVIVSVYHLGALQKTASQAQGTILSDDDDNRRIAEERDSLRRHFEMVSDLRARGVLYPVTMRQLLTILSTQGQGSGS